MRTVLVTARPFLERELSRWAVLCAVIPGDLNDLFEIRSLFAADEWSKDAAPLKARAVIAGIHNRRAILLGRKVARAFTVHDREPSVAWITQRYSIATRRATVFIDTTLAVVPDPAASWWGNLCNAEAGRIFIGTEIDRLSRSALGDQQP